MKGICIHLRRKKICHGPVWMHVDKLVSLPPGSPLPGREAGLHTQGPSPLRRDLCRNWNPEEEGQPKAWAESRLGAESQLMGDLKNHGRQCYGLRESVGAPLRLLRFAATAR